jgi:type II restriction enzyme
MQEKRDFEKWFKTMKSNINTPSYFCDFEKVYKNVSKIEKELNILSSLYDSKNIEEDFKNLYKKYPEILKVIPILISIRDSSIKLKDFELNFKKPNYPIEKYCWFMKESGIFEILRTYSDLKTLVTGIEIGLDSNGRKNRSGTQMENLIEEYIKKLGFKYYTQINTSNIEEKFGLDLSSITANGGTTKRLDCVIHTENCTYLIEVNFYSSGGSKLNETARSYKHIASELKDNKNVKFIWITDGEGWKSAKNNLKETFEICDIYNINDLENGILKKIVK